MKKTIVVAAMLGFSFVSNAVAADCVVHFNRTACAGQEQESYSKCNGTKECDKEEAAATKAACSAAAKKSCENTRLDITKSKIITATFQGKALKGGFGGGNFCAPNRSDFNKCGK